MSAAPAAGPHVLSSAMRPIQSVTSGLYAWSGAQPLRFGGWGRNLSLKKPPTAGRWRRRPGEITAGLVIKGIKADSRIRLYFKARCRSACIGACIGLKCRLSIIAAERAASV